MELGMSLEQAMRTQRSIRRIKPYPVDERDERLLLHLPELALKAASGGNRQNAEFIVVREPEIERRLARLNRVGWRTYSRIRRFFARNDPKALRTMKAVD